MKLTEIMEESLIFPELRATEKPQALRQMVEGIVVAHKELNPDELFRVIMEREELSSTGIGSGIAIPHARLASCNRHIAAFGRSRAGIVFDAIDGKPAHLIFLIVGPLGANEAHLKALARISKFLHDTNFRDHLFTAKAPGRSMKPSRKKTRKSKTSRPGHVSLHGVLIDVYGVGILLMGSSGVGKSESGLDLVVRGHRLVADDLVVVSKSSQGRLIGRAPDLSRYHIEVRGLGILNVRDLYGASAVRENKAIDMAIELVPWDDREDYDRVGIGRAKVEIMGVPVVLLKIPLRPGRNVSSLIEVAAKNQILAWTGEDSALTFERRQRESLCEP